MSYLINIEKQFSYYKMLGENTFEQLPKEKLFWQINDESNSISMIVKHLNGNMLSRWTDFLTSDGEKEWRQRDEEFTNDISTEKELLEKWQEGWDCLFNTLESLQENDLNKEIYIRNMGHSVYDAINRQLAHYAYHIGQIVFLGKIIQNEKWKSLSIPKNKSKDYNLDKFSKPKRNEHFKDDI